MPLCSGVIEVGKVTIGLVEVELPLLNIREPVRIEADQIDFSKPQVERQRNRKAGSGRVADVQRSLSDRDGPGMNVVPSRPSPGSEPCAW